MRPEQQHHIRNGSISIRRIARMLLRCGGNLSGNQKQMIEEIERQASRVERACKGECDMAQSKSWMTKTGVILTTVGTITASTAQVIPVPEVAPWMNVAAILAAGIGAALMGQGIRRRLPANRKQEG